MTLDSHLDAAFYNLIHHVVTSAKREARSDRRRNPRRPFAMIQRIAPRQGPGVPPLSDFTEVQCYDLTCSGFSFLVPTRPAFQSLVVALGTPPNEIFMAAMVAHCVEVLVYPNGRVERLSERSADLPDGPGGEGPRRMIQAGCRFTERIAKPAGF